MSLPANEVLTEIEIENLAAKGYRPDRYFPSTDEMLTYIDDAPYAYPLTMLRAMARPHLKQRIAQWFTGREGA